MAYKHGVYISEVPTAILPPVKVDTAIPFVVGTAPLHLSKTGLDELHEKVNYPVLCYTYQEAVEQFGFSEDWDKYTLPEFTYSQFALYTVGPVVFVNVLDPTRHKSKITLKTYAVLDRSAALGKDVILDSVEVRKTETSEKLTPGVDFSLGWNKDELAVLNVLDGGELAGVTEVWANFDVVDPSKVTSADIIGGYSVLEDKYEGMELINQVFPKYRIVPGLFVVPKWSEDPEVAAIMYAKADNICGCFRCLALVDIPSDATNGADKYIEVPEWKNLKNYVYNRQVACWPKIRLGKKVYHLSTQLAGLIAKTDKKWNDIPYKSPSNENLQMDSCINAAGKEIRLAQDQANYLNGNGVLTPLNWIGGWRAWGNRTAIYPASTDPKDAFIPIRRMFDWFGNELVLTWIQRVDFPGNRRTIETIIDSVNIRLNALASIGALVGTKNRVEFMESENPVIDMMDGIFKFHVYLTPPSPAREIDFILEYDVGNLESLWG